MKLPETGFVRIGAILGIVPISKRTWYRGVKSGVFPKPVKLTGSRASAWRVEDIRALLERLGKTQQAGDSKK